MSIRVLVVDDQELLRSAFRAVIDAEDDMEVVGEAADGAEAVRLASSTSPDVVVMDVRMPVMDGIEATRRITSARPDGPPRVLVLTTFDLDEYVFEALRAGASGFVLKSRPLGELLSGIVAWSPTSPSRQGQGQNATATSTSSPNASTKCSCSWPGGFRTPSSRKRCT